MREVVKQILGVLWKAAVPKATSIFIQDSKCSWAGENRKIESRDFPGRHSSQVTICASTGNYKCRKKCVLAVRDAWLWFGPLVSQVEAIWVCVGSGTDRGCGDVGPERLACWRTELGFSLRERSAFLPSRCVAKSSLVELSLILDGTLRLLTFGFIQVNTKTSTEKYLKLSERKDKLRCIKIITPFISHFQTKLPCRVQREAFWFSVFYLIWGCQ